MPSSPNPAVTPLPKPFSWPFELEASRHSTDLSPQPRLLMRVRRLHVPRDRQGPTQETGRDAEVTWSHSCPVGWFGQRGLAARPLALTEYSTLEGKRDQVLN